MIFRRVPLVRRRPPVVVALAAMAVPALLIVGCTQQSVTSSNSPGGTPSASLDVASAPPATDDQKTDSPCSLLDDATVTELLGDAPDGVEVVAPGSVIPACQFGDISSHGVQVVHVPAPLWARQLPEMTATILALPEEALDATLRQQIVDARDAIEAGKAVPADEACAYFSDLLEVAGQAPGTTFTVNYLPDLESAIGVSAQRCEDGMYSSIFVSREGVASDPLIVDQVSNLVLQLD